MWKLDRLGRSLKHLLNIVHSLSEKNIGFKVLSGQGADIDTTTAAEKLVFGIFASLAEFERELIRERTIAGLKASRVRGRKGGRRFRLTKNQVRFLQATYDIIEKSFSDILKLEESPVWSIDRHRGLVSKVDTLFCSEKSFTKKDIELFFDIAKFVLSEDDPTLDLPQSQRWAANLYEKTRDHSATLRKGVCETLVLLSTHGNNLFQKRMGIDIKSKVDLLIRSLLEPFDSRTWLSQQNDLPSYAEAAPEEFLNILELDIKNDNPQIFALFTPADTGIFGYCQRTGLLWALELLAWKPKRLTRVTAILARLSQIKIDDNWANKPINLIGK